MGGEGEGVVVRGGAGVRSAAPELQMFHEQIVSRNEATR